MACPDCTRAATSATWPGYHASCQGCRTRAIANGPQFWRSLQDRQRTPGYQKELLAVFGEDGAEAGHQAVKTEYQRLKEMRGGAP